MNTKPISQRTVSIVVTARSCTVSSSSHSGGTSGGWSSGSAEIGNPLLAKNIHDAVSYCRAYLSGDLAALPQLQPAADVELWDEAQSLAEEPELAHSVVVDTARNGYIVKTSLNDGHGWIRAFGDEVLFLDLKEMLAFCMDFLRGQRTDATVTGESKEYLNDFDREVL